jgi:hypothetical protein
MRYRLDLIFHEMKPTKWPFLMPMGRFWTGWLNGPDLKAFMRLERERRSVLKLLRMCVSYSSICMANGCHLALGRRTA